MRNEKGVALITALMVLCLLTLTGVMAMKWSITETHLATNTTLHEMEFYAAESGAIHGSIWLLSQDLKDDDSTDTFGPDEEFGFSEVYDDINEKWVPSNGSLYTWEVKHQQNAGGIMYYGDVDGDHLWEINNSAGYPIEIINSVGTHPRGGVVRIETRWQYQPAFEIPAAALWVHSSVSASGSSGSIVGEGPSDPIYSDPKYPSELYDPSYSCDPVPDIMFEQYKLIGQDADGNDVYSAVPDIDYDGNTGSTKSEDYVKSTGLYPLSLMLPGLRKSARYIITQDDLSGKTLPDSYDTNDCVLFVDGSMDVNNITGSGILVVDGDLEMSGDFVWEGVVLVNGDLKFSGGGNKYVRGAVVALGDAIRLDGGIDIAYDCNVLNHLQLEYSRYRMISWRQM